VAEQRQDILNRLADRGEVVIGRISEMPGAQWLAESVLQMRERGDEMQRRLRGLDALERRVDALERKVDELSKPKRAARKPAAKKPAAKPKPKSPDSGSGSSS
jgi:hypothetical protein